MLKKNNFLVILLLMCFTAPGCGLNRYVIFKAERPFMQDAHRYFKQGEYDKSLDEYRNIVKEYPLHYSVTEYAHFMIGYISIYYRNPKIDYPAALAAFETFTRTYPKSKWSDEAQNWIFHIKRLRALRELDAR